MGRVEDKVVFITGAARGQGRSHAVHLAEEGADIIAVDICEDIPSNDYPLARREDLDETARLVEKTGRRIVAVEADVRDRAALAAALSTGIPNWASSTSSSPMRVSAAGRRQIGGRVRRCRRCRPDRRDERRARRVATSARRCVDHHDRFGGRPALQRILRVRATGPGRRGLQPGQAGHRRIQHHTGGEVGAAIDPCQRGSSDELQHRHAAERTDVPGFPARFANPTVEEAEVGFRSMQAMPIPWVELVRHLLCGLSSRFRHESRVPSPLQLEGRRRKTIQRGIAVSAASRTARVDSR